VHEVQDRGRLLDEEAGRRALVVIPFMKAIPVDCKILLLILIFLGGGGTEDFNFYVFRVIYRSHSAS